MKLHPGDLVVITDVERPEVQWLGIFVDHGSTELELELGGFYTRSRFIIGDRIEPFVDEMVTYKVVQR